MNVFVKLDANPNTGIQNIFVSVLQAWMFVEVKLVVSCVLNCSEIRYAKFSKILSEWQGIHSPRVKILIIMSVTLESQKSYGPYESKTEKHNMATPQSKACESFWYGRPPPKFIK